MAIEITRTLEIDAGHRLLKHEGRCHHVHGHRYKFAITCEGALDQVGRVIDFSVVKQEVGAFLDTEMDHAFIAEEGDPIIAWLEQNAMRVHVVPFPPTAENLAQYVLERARLDLFRFGVKVVRVRCYETPNCWSDAEA